MIKVGNILGDKDQVSAAETSLRGANRRVDNILAPCAKADLDQLTVRYLLARLMGRLFKIFLKY